MKKLFKGCLTFIVAVLLIYSVYSMIWGWNEDRDLERVFTAMLDSMEELEKFCRENEDDLDYLVTRCVEDHILIDRTSVTTAGGGNYKDAVVDPELLSRRNRLIENLPSDFAFYGISRCGMELNHKDALHEVLDMMISSPPFTDKRGGFEIGDIGTIELDRTWTIQVESHSWIPSERDRARRVLEETKNKRAAKESP